MAYDISGNYTRVHNWALDRDNGIKIQATRMDEECNDYASSFNLLLLRDGRAPMAGNLKMGTNKITGLGAPTLAGDALSYGSVLGTPASGNLANCTALPLTTGVSGILAIANGGTGRSDAAWDLTAATNLPIGAGTTGTLPVNRGGTGNTTGSIPVGQITGTLPVANGGTGNTTGQAASCSGNSATATALTAGNQTIQGNLGVTGAITAENDANFGLHTAGGVYVVQLGASAGVNYDTSTGRLNFVVGGGTVAYLDSTGFHQTV